MRTSLAIIALWLMATPATAFQLPLPDTASETSSSFDEFTSYDLPTGPYDLGEIETVIAEGALTEKTWSLPLTGQTTFALMDQLRVAVESQGFELLYECETAECGGFDFRFNTRIVPEPAMRIDLGDFRFLSSQRLGSVVPEYLSLFVSRGFQTAFVQMIHVGPAQDQAVSPNSENGQSVSEIASAELVAVLRSEGHVVLNDLEFATGSAELGEGDYKSLNELARFLKANPAAQVTLVGHTDASGALASNVALSERRAASAADRLVNDLGVSADQVSSAGVGYLAPIASNQTDEGRTKNRRVEVVLTSTLE